MKWLLIGLVRLYQILVSPLVGHCCRFHPSCSQYAVESLKRHGFFRGSLHSIRRILRCYPGHPGGYDPIP